MSNPSRENGKQSLSGLAPVRALQEEGPGNPQKDGLRARAPLHPPAQEWPQAEWEVKPGIGPWGLPQGAFSWAVTMAGLLGVHLSLRGKTA